MRTWNRWALLSLALGIVACGDDGDGGSKGGASYDAILSAVEKPTGTVSASTAPEVANEFEKISDSGAKSRQKQAYDQTNECTNGGSYSVVGQGDQNNVTSTISYDQCCEGSCCTDGGGVWYFSTQQGASNYTYCGNYNVTVSCDGSDTTSSVQYEGCFGATGEWIYVVRVGGESFAVTGYYSNGSGELSVTGANGSYTCTYTDGSGSCTGTSGSFEF